MTITRKLILGLLLLAGLIAAALGAPKFTDTAGGACSRTQIGSWTCR